MEVLIAFLTLGLVTAQHGHGGHGGDYHPDSQTHIDSEIQNLDAHFGKHQCLDLLLVDCQHHVTNGDEMVCGSDGVTYANHCKFVHAACMYDGLSAAYMGQCTTTTMPASTVSPGNAAGSTTAGNTGAGSTIGPGSSATTAPPATTLSPEQIAFQNVFCRNKDSINCPTVVTPLCGSDGVVYDSSCHVSKARCDNPGLQTVDGSKCGLTTPVSVAPIVG